MLKRSLARLGRRVAAARPSRLRPAAPSMPPVAETEEFLRVARQSFVRLQEAWDAADLEALSVLTTEQLMAELRDQLQQRGPLPNHTEVLSLEARLLALEELREAFVASVEFSGLIRERLDSAAAPFRELWLLANLKSADRGWRLARVQALG